MTLVLLIVAGTAIWLVGSQSPPLAIATLTPSAKPGLSSVYVSGEVAAPGVYPFNEGDRVDAALASAGGPTTAADLTSMNLALRLKDEQRIYVPRRGEPTPPPVVPTAKSPAGQSPATSSAPDQPALDRSVSGLLLDLNSATAAELEALPGIGSVGAQKIVDYRARNGPFKQVEDLRTARLITNSAFEKARASLEIR